MHIVMCMIGLILLAALPVTMIVIGKQFVQFSRFVHAIGSLLDQVRCTLTIAMGSIVLSFG